MNGEVPPHEENGAGLDKGDERNQKLFGAPKRKNGDVSAPKRESRVCREECDQRWTREGTHGDTGRRMSKEVSIEVDGKRVDIPDGITIKNALEMRGKGLKTVICQTEYGHRGPELDRV